MFITAVYVIFFIELLWPKNKNLYDSIQCSWLPEWLLTLCRVLVKLWARAATPGHETFLARKQLEDGWGALWWEKI